MTAYCAAYCAINVVDAALGLIDIPLSLGRDARRAYHVYGQAAYPYAEMGLRAAALSVLLVAVSLVLAAGALGRILWGAVSEIASRYVESCLAPEPLAIQPMALASRPAEARLAYWKAAAWKTHEQIEAEVCLDEATISAPPAAPASARMITPAAPVIALLPPAYPITPETTSEGFGQAVEEARARMRVALEQQTLNQLRPQARKLGIKGRMRKAQMIAAIMAASKAR